MDDPNYISQLGCEIDTIHLMLLDYHYSMMGLGGGGFLEGISIIPILLEMILGLFGHHTYTID